MKKPIAMAAMMAAAGAFSFEPAYYLASVTQYVSDDGRHYIVGPIWVCGRQVDGRSYYPIVVGCGESDGRVYWCHETSRGSSGNFEVESEAGDFSLSDSSFCHSDEVKAWTYMTFASEGTTNKVILGRAD